MTRLVNDRFPGLPDYTGPTKGWFTLLHHLGPPFEWSDDVMERIAYINEYKPENERETRLRHIVFVSVEKPAPWVEFESATAPAWAEYMHAPAAKWAEYTRVTAPARVAVDAELAVLIPDCRWNGTRLVFPESE